MSRGATGSRLDQKGMYLDLLVLAQIWHFNGTPFCFK